MEINDELGKQLQYIGVIPDGTDVRDFNVGRSDYAKQLIQPWSIWAAYPNLTALDKDIIKRVLRTKAEPGISPVASRIQDYEKIIHICRERVRQLIHVVDTPSVYVRTEDAELAKEQIKFLATTPKSK